MAPASRMERRLDHLGILGGYKGLIPSTGGGLRGDEPVDARTCIPMVGRLYLKETRKDPEEGENQILVSNPQIWTRAS